VDVTEIRGVCTEVVAELGTDKRRELGAAPSDRLGELVEIGPFDQAVEILDIRAGLQAIVAVNSLGERERLPCLRARPTVRSRSAGGSSFASRAALVVLISAVDGASRW
jgi:hypothetical protein